MNSDTEAEDDNDLDQIGCDDSEAEELMRIYAATKASSNLYKSPA